MAEHPGSAAPAAGDAPAGVTWTRLGVPGAGIHLTAGAGALLAGGSPHVFGLDNAGSLWRCWLRGGTWQWERLGTPPDTPLGRPMGTLSINGYANVLLLDRHGTLWTCWLRDGAWQWSRVGAPPAPARLLRAVGTAAARLFAAVFVLDQQGRLWQATYLNGWHWDCLGEPGTGEPAHVPVGALPTPNNTCTAFLLDDTGTAWASWLLGGTPRWATLNQPGQLARAVGVLAVGPAPGVFGLDVAGNLWAGSLRGSAWQWGSLGQPPGRPLALPMGTAAVPGAPAVLLLDEAGTLWRCTPGPAPQWTRLGGPGPSPLVAPMGTLEAGGGAYAFGLDAGGTLWSCAFGDDD